MHFVTHADLIGVSLERLNGINRNQKRLVAKESAMKTMISSILALLVSTTAGVAFAAGTTVTGHLRDSFCFLTMDAHGPSHQKCAMGCAKAGIPVLLEQDKTNKYYVLLPPKDDQPLPASVLNKMEDEVTVSGQEYTKGGMTFLTVESVK
jgi:hypothetical protein